MPSPAALKKRQTIFNKTGGKCAYCGSPVDLDTFQADHANSAYNGGGSGIANLLPCCGACNPRKGHRDVEEFREWLTFRLIRQAQDIAKKLGATQVYFDGEVTAEVFTHLQEIERLLSSAKVTFHIDGVSAEAYPLR